jgi:hypothetical protein
VAEQDTKVQSILGVFYSFLGVVCEGLPCPTDHGPRHATLWLDCKLHLDQTHGSIHAWLCIFKNKFCMPMVKYEINVVIFTPHCASNCHRIIFFNGLPLGMEK